MNYKNNYTPNKKTRVDKSFLKKVNLELDKLRKVKKELKEKRNK